MSPVVFRHRNVAPCSSADQHERDPGEHGVGLEQVPERPGELLAGVDRQPVQQVAQGHADQQRGQQAARGQRTVPGAAPARRVALAAVLERDAADDQRGQQQHQREVEGGEHGRVPAGEGGEHRGPGDDQPDLVAVPQRPDRVDGGPAARLRRVPTTACSMPTPKSKPSRTKKPVHRTAMTMNQNGTRRHRGPSVLDRRVRGRRRRPSVRAGGEFLAGVPQHQDRSTMPSVPYSTTKTTRLIAQPGSADRRRDAVLGEHDALHDPRLPAALGQQPARGVHDERQHRAQIATHRNTPGRGEFLAPDQPQAPQRRSAAPGPPGRPSPACPVLDEHVRHVVARARTAWCTASAAGSARPPGRSSGWWPAGTAGAGSR